MVGTRFVVLKLKELIRIGAFVLVGAAVVVALVVALWPKSESPATFAPQSVGGQRPEPLEGALYAPGTYSVEIPLHNAKVNVSVKVGRNAIENVTLDEGETEFMEAFYPLFKPTMETLAKEIIAAQNTNVDAVPIEAYYTNKVLLDAVNTALSKAVTP